MLYPNPTLLMPEGGEYSGNAMGPLRNDWRLDLAQVPNQRILVGGLALTREEPAQLQPS